MDEAKKDNSNNKTTKFSFSGTLFSKKVIDSLKSGHCKIVKMK